MRQFQQFSWFTFLSHLRFISKHRRRRWLKVVPAWREKRFWQCHGSHLVAVGRVSIMFLEYQSLTPLQYLPQHRDRTNNARRVYIDNVNIRRWRMETNGDSILECESVCRFDSTKDLAFLLYLWEIKALNYYLGGNKNQVLYPFCRPFVHVDSKVKIWLQVWYVQLWELRALFRQIIFF